eukprot:gene710-1362_t
MSILSLTDVIQEIKNLSNPVRNFESIVEYVQLSMDHSDSEHNTLDYSSFSELMLYLSSDPDHTKESSSEYVLSPKRSQLMQMVHLLFSLLDVNHKGCLDVTMVLRCIDLIFSDTKDTLDNPTEKMSPLKIQNALFPESRPLQNVDINHIRHVLGLHRMSSKALSDHFLQNSTDNETLSKSQFIKSLRKLIIRTQLRLEDEEFHGFTEEDKYISQQLYKELFLIYLSNYEEINDIHNSLIYIRDVICSLLLLTDDTSIEIAHVAYTLWCTKTNVSNHKNVTERDLMNCLEATYLILYRLEPSYYLKYDSIRHMIQYHISKTTTSTSTSRNNSNISRILSEEEFKTRFVQFIDNDKFIDISLDSHSFSHSHGIRPSSFPFPSSFSEGSDNDANLNEYYNHNDEEEEEENDVTGHHQRQQHHHVVKWDDDDDDDNQSSHSHSQSQYHDLSDIYSSYLNKDDKISSYTLNPSFTIDTDAPLDNEYNSNERQPTAIELELLGARTMLGLDNFTADDFMETVGECSREGTVDLVSWMYVLSNMVKLDGGNEDDVSKAELLGRQIFDAFDEYKDGYVPFADLVAGMTVLCDSPVEDRVMVCFTQLDEDSDGFITVHELERLIFAVLAVVTTCATSAVSYMTDIGEFGLHLLTKSATEKCLQTLQMSRNDKLRLEAVSEFVEDCMNI